MKAELRIYGIDCYFTQPNVDKGDYSFRDYTNEEISEFSDEEFFKIAGKRGFVYSLYGFLREIEAHNFGVKSDVIQENMQFRAFLVDTEDENTPPIRIDKGEEYLMNVIDTGYSL